MISFIWPPGAAMLAGTGGSETYTAGHVRELLRMGIAAQVVTLGHGKKDGRQDFPDIPFLDIKDQAEIADLAGTVVFVNKAYDVPTRHKSAIILHCSVPRRSDRAVYQARVAGKTMIATSIYSGQQWALYLDVPSSKIAIVLPFADPVFGGVKRHKPTVKTQIVYAGRLHPEKGIYTLLEMMHDNEMQHNGFTVSIIAAGLHVPIGREIHRLLQDYPYARLLPAKKTTLEMAEQLARSDILLMPSVFAEPFGMLSIEAQHTGCRVVASNIGGLPETNCGLLTLVEPRNPKALITGIKQAVALGPATVKERQKAVESFTLHESVSSLLAALHIV